jgi:hypothetical protein
MKPHPHPNLPLEGEGENLDCFVALLLAMPRLFPQGESVKSLWM